MFRVYFILITLESRNDPPRNMNGCCLSFFLFFFFLTKSSASTHSHTLPSML